MTGMPLDKALEPSPLRAAAEHYRYLRTPSKTPTEERHTPPSQRWTPARKSLAHVGQVVADITPRIAHRNDGVALLAL
jgi:hypothetical protein